MTATVPTVPVTEVTASGTTDGEGFVVHLAHVGITLELWGDGYVQAYRTEHDRGGIVEAQITDLLPELS